MSSNVKWKPDGYTTVSPYLVVSDAGALMDFVKSVFGAAETMRMPGPDGKLMHGEARIGDTVVMMGTVSDPAKQKHAMLHIYVEDADAVYKRALEAGATGVRPVANQFYGDRAGGFDDAFGNTWYVSTHVEDVSPEELKRRMAAQFGQPS